MQCHGVAETVIVGGRVCVDAGDVRVAQGHGRYVDTPPFPPFVYDPERAAAISDEALLDNNVERVGEGSGTPATAAHHSDDESGTPAAPTLPDSEVCTPSCRGPRTEGQRNLQDSTFSISEELDGAGQRSCIRVRNPPGGKSSGGFW